MTSNVNCSYMAMSSLTYISGLFCEIFSATLFRLGILWDENHIKIFCLEIWVKMIFGWPTFKIMLNTPIYYQLVKLKTRWAITGAPLDPPLLMHNYVYPRDDPSYLKAQEIGSIEMALTTLNINLPIKSRAREKPQLLPGQFQKYQNQTIDRLEFAKSVGYKFRAWDIIWLKYDHFGCIWYMFYMATWIFQLHFVFC